MLTRSLLEKRHLHDVPRNTEEGLPSLSLILLSLILLLSLSRSAVVLRQVFRFAIRANILQVGVAGNVQEYKDQTALNCIQQKIKGFESF